MKKHFIFDFDDTISSSYEYNQTMFYKTFLPHENGKKLDETLIRKIHKDNRGTAMDYQFQLVINEFALDVSADQLTKENEKLHVENYKKGITIFDGISEFFDILKERDKKISMCTNRQYKSLNAILDEHGLRKYFENILSCKDEGHEKPDPKCLLDIVEKDGGNMEDFIYFGDSKTDYEFAANAGMDFVIVDHYLNGKNFYNMIIKSFL